MKYRFWFLVVPVALAAAVVGPTFGQAMNVTVDGRQVQFMGTRPMTVQGRVLVPLRGVLESMGAFVSWAPETRLVIAQKGDTYVELPVGARTATVNGRTVQLDVPAAVMGGSTMVPLRFLGEALGAEVRWDGAARTVVITTKGTPSAGTGEPTAPKITSFDHDGRGWLKAGSQLRLLMEGSEGGEAAFEIPGVVDQVKMKETGPGRYEATWVAPATTGTTVSGASVIGSLKVGGKERLIQAGNTLSIDTVPPKIKSPLPSPDSTISQTQPSISAVMDDGSGSGVDDDIVQLIVDGKDVTDASTVTTGFASYRPGKPLAAGKHTVSIALRDKAGNPGSQEWSFTVRAAADVIKSFTHSDLAKLTPGDVITVQLEAEAGGKAAFSIVRGTETLRKSDMREESPGHYAGEYTVRKDDNLTAAVIVGLFTTKSGETYTTQAGGQVAGSTSKPASPTVTAPKQDAAVTSPVTVTGTAPAGARVRLNLQYATTVIGAFRMTGAVADQMVDVAGDGKFKSEPIALGTLVKGKNTEYTLTAVTVDPSGAESDPIVVKFGAK